MKDFECNLLNKLSLQISHPTRYHFGMRFAKAADMNAIERSLLTYIMELSFLQFKLNESPHSKVAAAATYLVLQVILQFALQTFIYVNNTLSTDHTCHRR